MGVSERKEREKQARRDEILGAARRVFQESGYHATTMDRIAREVELSKAALYFYFRSKDDLFLSMTTEPLRSLKRDVEKIAAGKRGPEEKIAAMARTLVRHWEGNREAYQLGDAFIATYNPRSEAHRFLFGKMNEALGEILGVGVRIVEDGMGSNVFRNDLDPGKAILVGWRTLAGLLQIIDIVAASKREGKAVLDLAVGIFLEGIRERSREPGEKG